MTTTPRAPTGLGLAGRRFWKETQAAFVIEDHMVPILTETCRCLDRLSEVREALEGQPLTIESPRGGQQAHPLLATETALRRQLVALVKSLGLDAAAAVEQDRDGRGRFGRMTAV